MASCAEADAYYYIETEVTAAETETGALYAGENHGVHGGAG